jgi:hypothetical protein
MLLSFLGFSVCERQRCNPKRLLREAGSAQTGHLLDLRFRFLFQL